MFNNICWFKKKGMIFLISSREEIIKWKDDS